MEYYAAIKKEEILPFETAWVVSVKMGPLLCTQEEDLKGYKGRSYSLHPTEPDVMKVTQREHSPSPRCCQAAESWVGSPRQNQRSLGVVLSPTASSFFAHLPSSVSSPGKWGENACFLGHWED